MKFSSSILFNALVTALTKSVHQAAAQPVVTVTNGNDSGAGSLRNALQSGATRITFANSVKDITITDTLVYDATDALAIQGVGQTISANGDFTLLELAQGADLSISKVSFKGVGGFDAFSQGTGKGIFVDVPTTRTGVVSLDLKDVSVSDVAFHGIHVSDCDLADACGNGGGGGGDGSSASVQVTLEGVTVKNVGYGKFDGDGVRVDERGDGDIVFQAVGSTFEGAGADGVELDEGDAGDIIATVQDSSFILNGGFCNVIDAPPECYDDGELDLDDGFDIDEAGDGSLHVLITNSIASNNFDEGFDFDEEGAGDISATFVSVQANDNKNEGIKCSEEGDGDVDVKVQASTVNGNQDDGMQFESEGAGRIDVRIINTEATGSKKKDLKVEQDDGIDLGSLVITRSSSIGIVDTSNVAVTAPGSAGVGALAAQPKNKGRGRKGRAGGRKRKPKRTRKGKQL